MAKPYDNGLCFQLYRQNDNFGKPKTKGRNKGEIDNEEWVALGKYHDTPMDCIEAMIKLMVKDPKEPTGVALTVRDFKKINELKKAFTAVLSDYLSNVRIELVK